MKNKRLLGFLVLVSVMLLSAAFITASTIDLPKTGQTSTYATGDDGNLLKGATWPATRMYRADCNGTANASGDCVKDNLTGLIWLRDASTPTTSLPTCNGGSKEWRNALAYVKCLRDGSYKTFADWRLPNVVEFNSLINPQEPKLDTWLTSFGFTGMKVTSSDNYWSGTTYGNQPQKAWVLTIMDAKIYEGGDTVNKVTSTSRWTWPVRGGND